MTTHGYDQQYVIISDKESSVNDWLEYSKKAEVNPTKAIKDIEAGKYKDLRVPILIGNCHANEIAGVTGILEFIQLMLDGSDEIS